MSDQSSSYRQIFKATSLFGGVQVFQIIIQVIRSKFIAVLLGPTGVGIIGLLVSAIELIGRITNFGLGTSAVKDIAAANISGNNKQIALTVAIINRLVWITGLLGAIITLIFSSWLSQITFGNDDYTLAFIWISVTLLFNQLTAGQLVILQGMQKLRYLAKANLLGSFFGLIVTVPFYYIWKIDGIVPGIIAVSIITFSLSWYFSGKVKTEPIKVSYDQLISEGKSMLVMGFLISLSGLFALGASYIIRIFISNKGGIEQVGLFNAGFTIINTYVGLVFTAMTTDYYPRLSAVAHSNSLIKKTINEQAEMAILILAPILIFFIIFINWIIVLLYSNKFVPVNDMIIWGALGMFFKAASWSIGYVLLAKGAGKIFFFNELVCNIYFLALNMLGYHYLGFKGLGISFMVAYFLYLLQLMWISKKKYEFSFDSVFIRIFAIQFFLAVCTFVSTNIFNKPYPYFIGGVLFAVSFWYSFKELDKRLKVKTLISFFLKKNT